MFGCFEYNCQLIDKFQICGIRWESVVEIAVMEQLELIHLKQISVEENYLVF